MKKICMIVQDRLVKGGIAAVISGYYGSKLEQDFDIIYVESYKDGDKFGKFTKAIHGYAQFIKVLLVDRPDIIHIHSSFGPSFYRKLPFIFMASWAGKPIINHIHGADFNEFYIRAKRWKQNLIRTTYNKCTVLIALSDEWKGNLSKIVAPEKIEIVENYSVLHEDALKARLARNPNNIVLFLGEIGKRKGCYDIPAVAAEVVKVVPDVQFVLAGSGSTADERAVKALFKKYGISDHVIFPGWVRGKEKDQLLRKADVFFLPSYNEGMPMSVLDAMGYGLPIVSTEVGGIPKIVHNGENGYCCRKGDIAKFAKAIIELFKSRKALQQFGLNSYKIVNENYSLKSHIDKLEKIYNSLLLHK